MDGVDEVLERHGAARVELLQTIEAALRADERVEAALLLGSFGRGEPDAWSDLDVVVLVDDDVVADRHAWPARFGDVLYTVDSPWNAPVGGAQLITLYLLDSGLPLEVDWSFWPTALGIRPDDDAAALLFERRPGTAHPVDPASMDRPPRPTVDELDPHELRHLRFGMVPIAATFVARGERDRLVALLLGIGAAEVPPGVAGELAAVRERLEALAEGQPERTVDAVRAWCAVVAQHRAKGS